jgi:Na+-translocating ferredoxin:NAD+ oxidoreductase RnfD subunit
VKLGTLDLTRVWAAVTGLLLAAWFFGALYFGVMISPLVPMLITAIGGFELVLFGQDVWLKRRGENG